MKKRIMTIVLLFTLMVSLTGCIRIEADITVKRNGKADITLLYALNQSVGSFGGEESIDFTDEAEELRQEGWDVDLYDEDGYTGYRATKTNADLSETTDVLSEEGGSGIITKEGSLYILDMDAFGSDSSSDDTIDALTMIRSFGGSVKVRITFPTKPTAHNATSVSEDGRTLEWDLLDPALNGKIHAEFRLGTGFMKYAVTVSCITVAAALAIFLVVRSKNKKKAVTETVNSVSDADTSDPGQIG